MADAQLSETWSKHLNTFRPSKVLNQGKQLWSSRSYVSEPTTFADAVARSIAILGEVDGQTSLLVMEKTPFSPDFPSRLGFQQVETIEINDIVGQSS